MTDTLLPSCAHLVAPLCSLNLARAEGTQRVVNRDWIINKPFEVLKDNRPRPDFQALSCELLLLLWLASAVCSHDCGKEKKKFKVQSLLSLSSSPCPPWRLVALAPQAPYTSCERNRWRGRCEAGVEGQARRRDTSRSTPSLPVTAGNTEIDTATSRNTQTFIVHTWEYRGVGFSTSP